MSGYTITSVSIIAILVGSVLSYEAFVLSGSIHAWHSIAQYKAPEGLMTTQGIVRRIQQGSLDMDIQNPFNTQITIPLRINIPNTKNVLWLHSQMRSDGVLLNYTVEMSAIDRLRIGQVIVIPIASRPGPFTPLNIEIVEPVTQQSP